VDCDRIRHQERASENCGLIPRSAHTSYMTVSRGIYVIVIGSHAKDNTNKDTLPIDGSTCDACVDTVTDRRRQTNARRTSRRYDATRNRR
jgi:hypothetical protein